MELRRAEQLEDEWAGRRSKGEIKLIAGPYLPIESSSSVRGFVCSVIACSPLPFQEFTGGFHPLDESVSVVYILYLLLIVEVLAVRLRN